MPITVFVAPFGHPHFCIFDGNFIAEIDSISLFPAVALSCITSLTDLLNSLSSVTSCFSPDIRPGQPKQLDSPPEPLVISVSYA